VFVRHRSIARRLKRFSSPTRTAGRSPRATSRRSLVSRARSRHDPSGRECRFSKGRGLRTACRGPAPREFRHRRPELEGLIPPYSCRLAEPPERHSSASAWNPSSLRSGSSGCRRRHRACLRVGPLRTGEFSLQDGPAGSVGPDPIGLGSQSADAGLHGLGLYGRCDPHRSGSTRIL
jgi:hypothetical protein